MLALPGASGVLAASGDEPASAGFWAAVDSVGKLYAIKGRQIADDVKTNYLQLAGGDPDDLDVPSAIIEDGFMDGGGEQPAAEAAPEADPEPAAPEPVQQAAPAISDDAPAPVEAAPVEAEPAETAPVETVPAAETAESRLPMTLPVSSPIRVPPTETASGAGTLTLEDAEAPIKPAIPLDGGASAAQQLTLDAITTPQEPAPTAVTPAPVELAEDESETTVEVAKTETAKAIREVKRQPEGKP